ncbi:MAG TPA: hypothetical protein VK712_01885 [Verrucomicrobiae bacterium]|nr:hypothetical protein [Verrucomicrobiae bacterium]
MRTSHVARRTMEAFQAEPIAGIQVVTGSLGEITNAIYFGLDATFFGKDNLGDFVVLGVIFASQLAVGGVRMAREIRRQTEQSTKGIASQIN